LTGFDGKERVQALSGQNQTRKRQKLPLSFFWHRFVQSTNLNTGGNNAILKIDSFTQFLYKEREK
jgi:hypothetical protein